MPAPIERSQRYVPGLDGIRAVAVLCVIAYHLGVPWAQGGMLGVGVFFTLSGYLITDLLLDHYRRSGDLGLRQFWMQRARRLLPALFLMLAVVSVWVALFDESQLDEVRRQVISSALYFANWSTIAVHGSYFSRFAAPLPLDHIWSLSIEEQFYLVWPWLLLLAIRLFPNRTALAVLTLVGAAASALLMAHLYHPGYDPTRVYEGTDTRAFELLIGAALAVVMPMRMPRRARSRSPRETIAMDLAGLAGLIAIIVMVTQTSAFTSFLYPGGLILLSLATVALIVAVDNPQSLLGVLLSSRPLKWIGVRSYGIYLWQWPIVVLWGQSSGSVNWPRAALQIAVTMVIAAVSWKYVEDPIRRGALGRLWRRRRLYLSAAGARARRRTRLLSSGTVLGALIVICSLGGLLPDVSAGFHKTPEISRMPGGLAEVHAAAHPAARRRPLPPATRTSCRSVVYIGDSTSEGQISTDYIPNPRARLQAQLANVGVKTTYPEISGGRSIVETYDGHSNAATVARQLVASGYRGCWIIAMGTNDVADLAVGSNVGLQARISRMMSIIGSQPVMWVDAITLVGSGAYAESGMQRWNQDLLSACGRYPDMRIFDWAAHANRAWFIPDGIHYYSAGYRVRNRLMALGLVEAFPEGQPASQSCLVQ
jgi:peptidoglycan/LPS O-acetylase OafA/YrhL